MDGPSDELGGVSWPLLYQMWGEHNLYCRLIGLSQLNLSQSPIHSICPRLHRVYQIKVDETQTCAICLLTILKIEDWHIMPELQLADVWF
jgi:hypothetical protein